MWAGLARSPAHTTLTVLTLAACFVALGLLKGLDWGLENVRRSIPEERLWVTSRWLHGKQPVRHLRSIANVPGVREVVLYNTVGGRVRGEYVRLVAVSPAYFASMREYALSPTHLRGFQATRTGIAVGHHIAEELGWEVGDRVSIESSTVQVDGSPHWEFEVVGLWRFADLDMHERDVFMRYDYLDSARTDDRGLVQGFVVHADTPGIARDVAARIDDFHLNTAAATRSLPWRTVAVSPSGHVGFVANAIVAVSLAATLLVVAAALAQSFSVRQKEFGVLRAVGFRPRAVAAILFCEAAAICLGGMVLGYVLVAGAGRWVLDWAVGEHRYVEVQRLITIESFSAATLVAVALAALGTMLPSVRLYCTTVVHSLDYR